MAELPSGTVTFLFTDIEGSTRLLKQLGDRYGELLEAHRHLLRVAFEAHGGREIDSQGDSFFVAFPRAKQAIAAAIDGQRALAAGAWPEGAEARVRMGLHSGEPVVGDERYVGIGVHRAARIGAAAHGGQVLVSSSTKELVEDDLPEGISLRDLGLVRLKDIDRPERISQLVAEGLQARFPPLRTGQGRRRVERRLRVLVPVAALLLGAAVLAAVVLMRGSAEASGAVAADSLGVFQSPQGKLVTQASVGASPRSVALGEGSVWVTNADDHSVSRIDPKTGAVMQTIQVGSGPSGIAVAGGFVWVANSLDGTVSQIDPRTNGEVRVLQVGNEPTGVASGGGGVWVANSSDRTVVRIDARSGAMRSPIAVDAGADGIAFGEGAVWVTSEAAGSVARIEPRSGAVQTINVGNGPAAVAVGGGAVWVADRLDGTVSRIDPTSNQVLAVIPVGDGPSGVAVAGKVVWVSSEFAGTLSRIDPGQNRVVSTVKTGNRPEGVAATSDATFVAVRASSLAHRGGRLTIVQRDPEASIDTDDYSADWSTLILTNDGLVAFRRVGGSDGTRLVPDLATSLPSATDGGRTSTFQLRRGIRYSTGALVRPADFRRAIERVLAKGDAAASYYTGIIGAEKCLKTPTHCDLSTGIATDTASNTISFRLTAPDPDLLYKLALPEAFAVPANTPLKAHLPLPATGPYLIASYDPKRELRLVRNPRFREWSPAAQPDGYPNQIVWRFAVAAEEQVRAVERGSADLARNIKDLSTAALTTLRTRQSYQLHLNPKAHTNYFFLNTRLSPFNNVKARRAVNYAVDRNRLVGFGAGIDQTSCQVLPPNLAGYHRYCPYTVDPSADGKYTGPDLPKARELVAASGTKGQAVTVWIPDQLVQGGGAYFVSVLHSLGYRALLKTIPASRYFQVLSALQPKMQSGVSGWGADYASASDFFPLLLTCSSYLRGNANNNNLAGFCNPHIDSEINHALSLRASDPQTTSKLWRKIDHDIADQAPWVTINNSRSVDFVSRRVGNYQYNPQWGVLLDQLWVR